MLAYKLARLIDNLFASNPRAVRPAGVRLRVDRLEGRDVPAVWKNITGDFDANNLANWEFSGYEPTDHVSIAYFFGGPYGCVDPCEGLAGDFDSISVASNYTGTITLGGDVTTWWLYQAGGTIDQPLGTGSEITVFQAWDWYGGTLNSTATASTLTVDASNGYANATIAPTSAGTVYLGSTLRFIDGVTATIEPGTIDAHNDPDIELDDCQMAVNTYTVNTNVAVEGVRQINVLNTADLFTLTGPGTFNATNQTLAMYNHAGVVTVNGGGTLNLKGQAVVGGLNRASYYQDGGTLWIESGATVKVSNALQLSGGQLQTLYNQNLADTVAAQTATIDGDFYATAGYIFVCVGGPPTHYGTLHVKGAVVLEGTTVFQPYIDGTTTGRCDRILADSNVSVNQLQGSSATLSPSNLAGNNTVANGVWRVIESSGNYTGTIATSNLQFWPGPPARAFTVGTLGNPINTLTLNT